MIGISGSALCLRGFAVIALAASAAFLHDSLGSPFSPAAAPDQPRPAMDGAAPALEAPAVEAPAPEAPAAAGMPMPAAAALLDRPLFSKSRRPPPPAPPPPDTAAAPAPPPPPFQGFLRGIVIGHGGPVALIGHPGQAETITLRESERIDGWLVARIEPGALVLRSGDTETRLDITPPALSVRPAGMTPAKPASAPPEAQQASPGANAPAGGRSTLAVYRRAR